MNLKDRVRRLERKHRTVDAALYEEWAAILHTLTGSPPLPEEIRQVAVEGKSFARWYVETLRELWQEEERRERAGFLQ